MSWMVLVAVGASAAILCGCSDASGQVQGGQLLLSEQASCGADAGHAWTDLYGCYFGPTGKASCAALGECHGALNDMGSGGAVFVCGPTQESCYQGITTAFGTDAGAVTAVGYVLPFLRTNENAMSGQPSMPCNPYSVVADGVTDVLCNPLTGNAYVFSDDDIARINAWIGEGAPND